mmetsp:Transcript_18369/g.47081  ORF Transcript_18369/g.47081 Transcript_18369/m.47081 type:complete len:229 (+) Transcript_18369:296-982(+)
MQLLRSLELKSAVQACRCSALPVGLHREAQVHGAAHDFHLAGVATPRHIQPGLAAGRTQAPGGKIRSRPPSGILYHHHAALRRLRFVIDLESDWCLPFEHKRAQVASGKSPLWRVIKQVFRLRSASAVQPRCWLPRRRWWPGRSRWFLLCKALDHNWSWGRQHGRSPRSASPSNPETGFDRRPRRAAGPPTLGAWCRRETIRLFSAWGAPFVGRKPPRTPRGPPPRPP